MELDKFLDQLEALDADEIDAAVTAAAQEGRSSPNRGESGGFRQTAGNAVEAMFPFAGIGERIEENKPADGYTGLQETGLGLAKGFTFAQMGNIGALGEELGARIRGDDDQTFAERRKRNNTAINENSNIVGEIGGAIAGGPRLAYKAAEKGIQKLPGLGELIMSRGAKAFGTRTLAAGTLGAAESAVYRLAEGGDLDDAQKAAIYGGVFGVGGQATVESIANAVKFLGPALGTGADIRTSEGVVRAIRTAYGDDMVQKVLGQDMLNADAVAAAIRESGSDTATLTEIFPKALVSTVRSLDGTQNIKIAAATRDLMEYMENLKNMSLPEFQEGVGRVLGSADVRSAQDIINQGHALRTQLQPMYDDALKNVARFPSGKARGVRVRDVRDQINNAFRGASGGVPEAAQRRLLSLLPSDRVRMSPKQLLELRQSLDSAIYTGKFPAAGSFDEGASIDRTVLRNYLTPARNKVREMLYATAPDLKKLDGQYGDEISLRHAYDAGTQAFKAADGSAVFETFLLRSDRTAPEMANFVEGVKAELIKGLEGKLTATQVNNYLNRADVKGSLQLVEQVAGREVVEGLRAQANRYALVNQVTKGVDANLPSVFSERTDGFSAVGNALLMAGSAGNLLSKSIGAGAANRELAKFGRRGTGPVAEAGVLNDLLSQPADMATKMLNKNLQQNMPSSFSLLPGMVPMAPTNDQ